MSKETTPMQDLIEWSQNDLEIFCEDSDEALRIFKAIKDKATELLEEEKQMVVDAHESGWHVGYRGGLGQDAEQYFKETYQQ